MAKLTVDGVAMGARFPGKCAACAKRIDVDDSIVYGSARERPVSAKKVAIHVMCNDVRAEVVQQQYQDGRGPRAEPEFPPGDLRRAMAPVHAADVGILDAITDAIATRCEVDRAFALRLSSALRAAYRGDEPPEQRERESGEEG